MRHVESVYVGQDADAVVQQLVSLLERDVNKLNPCANMIRLALWAARR